MNWVFNTICNTYNATPHANHNKNKGKPKKETKVQMFYTIFKK
jgi:hypothetical protein